MANRSRRHRRRRNRGRFGFLYKFLSALLIFAAILTGCVVFFRADKILVTGESRYTEQQIVDAAGVQIGENLFQISKPQIVQQVLTTLPYVDELAVVRKLPDTLILDVSECRPVASIRGASDTWLMDAKCKLLERGEAILGEGRAAVYGITPLAPTVGVELAVDEAEQQKLESLRGLLAALRGEQMTGSVRDFIDLTADNKIRFSYGEHLTIVMPFIANFETYVFRLKRILLYMDEKGVERTGTLDLTYEDGAHLFVERWLPDPSVTAPPAEETQPVQQDGQGGTDDTQP